MASVITSPEQVPSHRDPLNRWDVFALLFCVSLLLAECLWLDRGRQPWSDEIFGWLLIGDHSFIHMLRAWRLAADGGGIFFYLTARAWALVFGSAAWSLRFMNALALSSAFTFLWVTARRWYRLEIVAFSLPFFWFTAHSVLCQLMIGRFYGMLMASVSAVVLVYAITSSRRSLSLPQLFAVFATNCLLAGIHPIGFVYSAVLLFALVGVDLSRHSFRPRIYASAMGGWWILWPSRFAMKASAAVTKPHFWTTTPTLLDLRDAFFFWTDEIEAVIIILIVCLAARWIWFRRAHSHPQQHTDTLPLILGAALLSIIPALWLKSLHGTSYFVDRYLTPTVLGASLLVCGSLQRLIPATRPRWQSVCLASAAIAVACGAVYGTPWQMSSSLTIPPRTYTQFIESIPSRNHPIVIERVDIFAEAIFSTPELPLYHLLDWPSVSSPDSPRGEVSGYHEMENWQRAGYYTSSIQSSEEFLAQNSEFWVVSDPSELWFSRTIQSNPSYIAVKTGEFRREHDVENVWHVRRKY